MTVETITSRTRFTSRHGRSRYVDIQEMRQIAKLATPIALVAMINMAMSITDTLMVATLGPDTMAAVAVGSDFYSILFYLATGLLAGLTPAHAEAWAADDHRRLARLRTVGWALLLTAAAPVLPIIWFAPDYLGFLGIDLSVVRVFGTKGGLN